MIYHHHKNVLKNEKNGMKKILQVIKELIKKKKKIKLFF